MNLETYLENQLPEMKRLLEQLVNTDSNTYDKQGVDRIGSILKKNFEEVGMKVVVHPEKKFGNQLEVTASENNNPAILIIAHMDTVYPKDTTEKYHYKEIGDKGYGPGINDEKGSHVSVLYAVKALQEIGSRAYQNIHIIFNSDEEVGSPASKELILKAAEKKSYSLVVEAGRPDDTVVSERKGVGDFQMRVKGKSAETEINPEKGKSAVEAIAHKVIKMHELNNLENGVSVNIGILNGGVAPQITAPHATGKIDVRVPDKKQEDKVTTELERIAETKEVDGTETLLEGKMSRPPMIKTEETEKLLQVIKQAGKELNMEIKDERTGGGSDASFTAAEGIPTIDGMGPMGEFSHNLKEEYLDLKTFPKRTALLAKTIQLLSREP